MKTQFKLFSALALLLGMLVVEPAEAQTPTPYATAVPLPNMSRGPIPLERALAGLTFSLVAGAGADTNITVPGITTADRIVQTFMLEAANSTDATLFTALGTEVKITAANTIQVDVTVSTGHQLLVIWYDMDGYVMPN